MFVLRVVTRLLARFSVLIDEQRELYAREKASLYQRRFPNGYMVDSLGFKHPKPMPKTRGQTSGQSHLFMG